MYMKIMTYRTAWKFSKTELQKMACHGQLAFNSRAPAETWDDRWLFSYYPFTGTKCIFEDAGAHAGILRVRDGRVKSDRHPEFLSLASESV